MTRKHYVLIARVLRDAYTKSGQESYNTTPLEIFLEDIIHAFREENPRFNAKIFFEAVKCD